MVLISAKNGLEVTIIASNYWLPNIVGESKPVFRMEFSVGRMCEQVIRKHTEFMGLRQGVNIHQAAERVAINFLRKD